jgi:glycopeptide antibiotics resistance protein
VTEKLIQFALICLCVLPVWLLVRKPWKRRPAREIAMCLFVAYIAALLVMALEGNWASPAAMLASARERLSTGEGLRLTPFETIRLQLSSINTDESRTQLLGNTLLFLPWGFFLPLLWKRFRRFFPIAGMCLGLTCFIESTQFFIGRTVDVDDLLLNFCGSIAGTGLWWLIHRLRKE